MSTTYVRGSGLLEAITPADLSRAVEVAYAKLADADRAVIDNCAEQLVAAVARRRAHGSAGFGPASAIELLSAIGRIL